MNEIIPYNNVYHGDFYTIIKEHFSRIEKYDSRAWTPNTFNSFPNASVTCFDKGWISDVISSSALQNMDVNNPMFIIAQTGSGKTTFIFKKIIKNTGKKVLYLCSRASLAAQIKSIAMNDEIVGASKQGNCLVKEMKKFFSEEGIQNQIEFGPIHVTTYQKLIYFYDDLNVNNYEYVICDEAHFFLSDSTFNPFTSEALSIIVNKFKNAKRLYLSATPHNSIDLIMGCERSSENSYNPKHFHIFYSPEKYTYLSPHFFINNDDIIDEIIANPDKSWLIFVSSKNQGEDIQKVLSENSIEAKFISADTAKNDYDYQKLLATESLPVKCLIATRVLDVGVNIKNKNLNIVVFESDIVEQKQMIGRKRVNNEEKVNVYFYCPSLKELSKIKNGLNKRIADFHEKRQSISNGNFIEKIEHPFFARGKQLCYNELCVEKLQHDYIYYKRLSEYLGEFETQNDAAQAYAQLILSNYDNIVFSESELFICETDERVKNLLISYETKELCKENFKVFGKQLSEITGELRVKDRPNPPGLKTINDFLEKYDYHFETDGTPTKYTLIKGEGEIHE